MKKFFALIFVIFFALSSSAQVVRVHKTDDDFAGGNLEPSPRLRVNRSSSLTLSNTWQRLDLNGTSLTNVNTFPAMGATKRVYWDGINKLFKFTDTSDRNFFFSFYYKFSGGLRPVDVLVRFVIPNGVSPGVNYYFPFPESDGFLNLVTLERLADYRGEYNSIIYSTAAARANGVGVEIKSNSVLLTYPTLTDATLLIYGR